MKFICCNDVKTETRHMTLVGFAMAFADFASPLPISQVAEVLSSRVFGGIAFIEKDVDGEHDLGTLRLVQDYIGLEVNLFGKNGRYTVELGTVPSASVAEIDAVCDLSAMLKQAIESRCNFKLA